MHLLAKFLPVFALGLLYSAGPGDAAEDEPSAKLNRVQQQIDQTYSRHKALSDELKALRNEEEQISSRLINLASRIQTRESMITAGERRILTLGKQYQSLRNNLNERREALTKLLAGLQRLERNRPPPLATQPDDAVAAIRGAMLFGAVVPALNAETAALARTLAELDTLRARLMTEQAELREHLSKLDKAHKEIAELHARKSVLIKKTGAHLDAETKRALRLAGKAKSLKQLVEALAKARKRKREEEAAELAERERLRQMATLNFKATRGQIEYPAQGRLIRRFGEKDSLGNISKGVYIATRRDGQVTAPAGGKVEYAGEFRSYGKLLILDVGQGYHILLAGLERLTAETGQFVKAGEPIGQMGNTSARGTLVGEELDFKKPILYVEFRVKGRAVDSSSWWIGNRKEARR